MKYIVPSICVPILVYSFKCYFRCLHIMNITVIHYNRQKVKMAAFIELLSKALYFVFVV